MSDVNSLGAGTIEVRSDLGTGDAALFSFWKDQVDQAEKEHRKWVGKAKKIVKRYRDEEQETLQQRHKFNILWSNVQTLIPTLYARTPKADVERRFRDQDDTGRLASDILQRAIEYQLEAFDFDGAMGSVVQDRLLPGRGTARVLYIPHYGEVIPDENADFENAEAQGSLVDGDGDDPKPTAPSPEPTREVVFEEVEVAYVFWGDYLEGPARQWKEVPWLRYRSYMTRDQLTKRFGSKKGKSVALDYTAGNAQASQKDILPVDIFKKAIIDEFWDKTLRRVVWLAPGTPDLILDQIDDPLQLPDFFPSPNPLLATTTNDKRIPVPDYVEYQDQAHELDNLTARIDVLTRALKVSGVYAGEEKQALQQLVDDGTDNLLIPVHDWQAFTEKGGLAGLIYWMPIQQVAETLIQLYNARDKTKALLYEITGLSDIMRGSTDPNETLGAQQLKANFSTRRIGPQQKDVARFARDIIRLIGQIIAGHFSDKTISMITNYPQLDPVPPVPPQPQQPMSPQPQVDPQTGHLVPSQPDPQAMQAFQQVLGQWQQAAQKAHAITASNAQKQQQFSAALALIRDDVHHGFRIDIEADSTIAADEMAEKAARTEFVGQLVPLMEQVIPLAQGNPPLSSFAKEIVLFAVRGFKVARSMEETIEKAFDAIAQMPPNPKVSGQDQKGTQSNTDSPADLALRAHETDSKTQIAQQANAIKAQQVAGQLQIEQQRLQSDQALAAARLEMERQSQQDQATFRGVRAEAIQGREAQGLT